MGNSKERDLAVMNMLGLYLRNEAALNILE
jgi:hypothetical protein